MMKLYAGPASPFVRKVRIVIHELELEGRIDVIMTKPPERTGLLPEFNPLVKIPVLVAEDGDRIYDSPVIVEYLATLIPGAALFDTLDREGHPLPAWRLSKFAALGDGIAEAAVNIGAEWRRPSDGQSDDYIDRQRTKIVNGIAALEKEVVRFGDAVTIGSIAGACGLGQVDFLDLDEGWRDRHPTLAAWHARFAARDSYRDTAPRQNKG